MKVSIVKWLALGLMLVFAAVANAQDFEFHPPATVTEPAADKAMRDLASRILPVYQENNQDRFLANLSALQLVARDYSSAWATRQSLAERRQRTEMSRVFVYDVYARARAIEVESRTSFERAFTLSYQAAVPKIDDHDEYVLAGVFSTPLYQLQDSLQRSFDQKRSKGSVSLAEALDLVWSYLAFDAYRSFGPLAAKLNAGEDRRRYITEESTIKTRDGASISAVLVRPKLLNKLPTLFEFTTYDYPSYAKEAAAWGYVGVVAYARGIHKSTGDILPFEKDGEDARAVIEWIAKQEWSNGRVGMYGSGYSGFAAWAATKRAPLPAALKAIATTDATVPGIDMPMDGNIFQNSAYRWLLHISGDKSLDDDAAYRAFNQDWYAAGRSYRQLASATGNHSPTFEKWLSHPSYDWYWQRMVPFHKDFAHINIPVLTTTGYYSDAAPAALYYFTEHHKNNPKANHMLLIGPYDESGQQRGVSPLLKSYVDSVAYIDLRALRYQWFDNVLKDGKPLTILTDRVNYQAMGTNEWRHAPALPAATEKNALRFFLEEVPNADRNKLTLAKSTETTFLPQTFDFADRTDVKVASVALDLVSRGVMTKTGEIFVSEPLKEPTEIEGMLSGELDFRVNKMDMDVVIALYELLPNGDYLKLFDPSLQLRASYMKDRIQRHLLKAGVRQRVAFKSSRMTSRRLSAGSRVVMVLGVNKRSDRQINYGTGGDVSEESIENANVPLKIRWYNSSYIEIPVRGALPAQTPETPSQPAQPQQTQKAAAAPLKEAAAKIPSNK